MREISLEVLYAELLRIATHDFPASPEFDALLNQVREDLKKAKVWGYFDTDQKRPLSDWWAGYAGLSSYIDK